ncbi:MAG: sigma-70 family RNA polymerase sigma factor [Liquorilactobacillus nagelii]|jgi:RNA polymerase sporulation-specific sigma factor|uniref:RNA polymerase sigma factor n=1 Tax=Liquorilactobacillus nagelii TaxID=82688 RepID=UPI0039EB76DA
MNEKVTFLKSNLENQQLVQRIKEHKDNHAFKTLFNKYTPVVCGSIARYHFRFFAIEDLLQEARLVCYQAVLAYDLQSPVSFGKYFQKSLQNHYCSLLRKENAAKRQKEKYAESFEETFETTDCSSTSLSSLQDYPLSILIAQEQLVEASKCLSQLEFEILYLLAVEHLTPEEIAADLDKDIIQITRAVSRCHKKISETISKR